MIVSNIVDRNASRIYLRRDFALSGFLAPAGVLMKTGKRENFLLLFLPKKLYWNLSTNGYDFPLDVR